MGRMRAALIGAGWIAASHLAAIDASDEVELVAVCDVDPARARAAASLRGARALTRWEDLLDGERLDLLWVCTPPLTHQASGAVCAVGYQWHASALLRHARQALDGHRIGLLCGRNYGAVAERGWFLERRSGGGQILERGSHQIDLQRALAGEIAAVQAVAGAVRLRSATIGDGDIEDVVALTLRFCSGALGTVTLAWTAPGQPGRYGLDVIAAEASLWLELGPQRFSLGGRAGTRELDAAEGDPLAQSIACFLRAARSRDPQLVACSPEDALRTLEVARACERSIQQSGALVPIG